MAAEILSLAMNEIIESYRFNEAAANGRGNHVLSLGVDELDEMLQ